jgi:hypothetical protein
LAVQDIKALGGLLSVRLVSSVEQYARDRKRIQFITGSFHKKETANPVMAVVLHA